MFNTIYLLSILTHNCIFPNCQYMFYGAAMLNGDVSKWDVSSVIDMGVSHQSSRYLL